MVLPPEQDKEFLELLETLKTIEIKEEKEKKRGKFQKVYSKPCPLCSGEQELFQFEEEIDGVIYDRHYLECCECLNRTELNKDHHKLNLNTKYEWQ